MNAYTRPRLLSGLLLIVALLCVTEAQVSVPREPTTDVCSLPADSGPCDAAFKRWHFNSTAGQCMIFIWGGCQGNANNFEDEGLCQDKCDIKQPIVDPPPHEPVPEDECPALPAYVPDYCMTSRYAPGCSENKDCSGGLCCPDQCGILMCNKLTAEPRQGECPMRSNVDCGITPNCESDIDCPEAQKCCFSPNCGDPRCMDPVKPGYCPPSPEGRMSTCLVTCENDYGCGNGSMKCCTVSCNTKCVEAVSGVIKDGNCPQFDWSVKCATQPGVCSNDAECSGKKKCCKTPCGSNPNCLDPVKPGDCPPLNPLLDCAQPEPGVSSEPDGCTNDTACDGIQKCCPVQCKTAQCQDPVTPTVKSGECPSCDPATDSTCNIPSGNGISSCESDAGCWDTAKCCSLSAGGRNCLEPDICSLPAEPGRCRGAFERWFFDWKADKCMTFTWGGCDDGNANNFKDEAECQANCQPKSPVIDTCSLPAEPGRCKGAFERWFFDWKADKCMTFTWGGCDDGNANNFKDEAECQANCQTKIPVIEEGCAYYDKDQQCVMPNPRQCDPSENCDTGDLCCSYECGGTRCQKNACPAFDRTAVCKRANDKNCTDSSQCGTGQNLLCCQYECEGTKCYDPGNKHLTNEKTEVGEGSSESSGRSSESSSDNAKPPAGGQCPADRVGRKYHTDVTCSSDDGCPGNKKCCSRAGFKVCRTPDTPKAGTCPNVKKKLNPGKPVKMKCDSDAECCDNLKCCETATGGFDCAVPEK